MCPAVLVATGKTCHWGSAAPLELESAEGLLESEYRRN